jgi:hypothetical protein
MPKDMLTYVEEEYIVSEKIISRDSYQSSDKLTKTLITHFSSSDDRDDYLADPKIKALLKIRNEHCRANGIKITILTQEYDDDGIISSNTNIID